MTIRKIRRTKAEIAAANNVFDFKAQMLLSEGVNIHTREILFAEDVSMKAYRNLSKHLDLLKTLGSEPVTILLTTSGGDVYAMLAIMDRLQQYELPINIYALGEVASAGIPIFACGDIRITGEFTRFMIHPLSYNVQFSKIDTHKAEMQLVTSLERKVNQYMAKKTTKPYQWWNAAGAKADLYINADTAIEIGLAQKMVVKE